jgi:hypothetical protein
LEKQSTSYVAKKEHMSLQEHNECIRLEKLEVEQRKKAEEDILKATCIYKTKVRYHDNSLIYVFCRNFARILWTIIQYSC